MTKWNEAFNKKNNLPYIIAVIIPILILCGMLVKPLLTVQQGTIVSLQTIPLDPTDLFRGDYVSLRYEIEVVDIQKSWISIDDLREISLGNGNVYIQLVKGPDLFWTVSSVTKNPPTDDSVYLKAKLAWFDSQELHLIPGIGDYYLPEGQGVELERLSAKGELVADIYVKDGLGIIKTIYPLLK